MAADLLTQIRDNSQRSLQSTYCPFCADYYSLPVVQAQDTADAFALSNLLPAGTITIAVHEGESACPSASKFPDWRSLPLRNLSTHPEDTLFRELAFLTEHLFLRATCRLGISGHTIFIRLYLIPEDLSNVQGRLRRRPESVTKEARRYMRTIVPLIEQDGGLWNADEAHLNATQKHFLPCQIDNRTIAEIYSDLPSPVLKPPTNENEQFCHYIASEDVIWGLRSTLYGYQRHSVSVMLQKESSSSPVPDPSYIVVPCMSGIHCHVQPSTMTILRERPMFSPSRGGILCEELGTGKTVMIIALALATAGQLPDPEESAVDERPVMTPLAYRHFPSPEYSLARDRAGLGRKSSQSVPSLVELLVHYFSSTKVTSRRPIFADELEASHLWPSVRANRPFYHHYDTELAAEALKRSRRQSVPHLRPRTMYLSSATLIIVPLTLLGQWKNEIDKHSHDFIRYLVVRPSTELPDARKLASDYELIIMSDTRFRKESKKNNIEKLYELKSCSCPCLLGTRIPDCHCPGDPDVTPLLQVRWKRLVIDEGHIAGNMAATINYFVRQLSIQHKWIVTGTPTSNILGLDLGRTIDEQESNDQSTESVLDCPSTATSLSQDGGSYIRTWGDYESLNLRKLGTMIGDFLSVPPFSTDSKSFTIHISAPLCAKWGPIPGAINVLDQVMQMVMVRHRIEDVEKDVLLPPMTHDIVFMGLDKYAIKSYNAMQAALAINAIDSNREGSDYLFHQSKTKELQIAINNSAQGLFWSSSDILYNVDQIFSLADEYIDRAVNKHKVGPEDLDLLQQALKHVAAVANDETWRTMQPYPDVPFKVSGLDPTIFEAWTRTGLRCGSRVIDVMHPDRLANLRTVVRKNPLISRDGLVKEGNIVDKSEERKTAPKSKREARHSAERAKEMVKDVQETIDVLKKHVIHMSESDEEIEDRHKVIPAIPNEPASAFTTKSSLLSGVKVGPSLSTKLNYIISEVCRYSAQEKFLIFSNSLLTLYQIGEALALFEIKYLRYTNEEKYLLREQCITTFETSDVHRVLLIDLKLGARGLNLISASRIIFCEPVWHPDVESQAIKRVHRIGQTKPVTVKTLVIRSTSEETMIARRQYLRNSDKVPSMTTETGMRDYLMHPRFLSECALDEPINLELSLDVNEAGSVDRHIDSSPDDSGGASRVDIDSDNPTSVTEVQGRDGTARKRVRFE